jgi:hypothetical protein
MLWVRNAAHCFHIAAKANRLRVTGLSLVNRPINLVQHGVIGGSAESILFLRPVFENRLSDGWTVFDLRALRSGFATLGKVDEGLERASFGYDLLVVIPQASASHDVD